jgi:hypothetical protein
MGFGGFPDMAALWAPDNGGKDVPFRPNPVQHGSQLLAQFDQIGERQTGVPSSPENLQHLREPRSLSIASSHSCSILSPQERLGAG